MDFKLNTQAIEQPPSFFNRLFFIVLVNDDDIPFHFIELDFLYFFLISLRGFPSELQSTLLVSLYFFSFFPSLPSLQHACNFLKENQYIRFKKFDKTDLFSVKH